jgi:hypothetical protein
MKFNKLPKEKRQQLILVVIGAVVLVSALGLGLIRYQYSHLARLAQNRTAAEAKLQQVLDAVRHADQFEAEVKTASHQLAEAETDLASGDLYSWDINLLREFKAAYHVEIPQFGQIEGPKEVTLLPGFPYKQATLTVAGSAHFHDLGHFLADLENKFPHIRVLNLSLDSSPNPTSTDPEALSFRMDLVTLVKQNPS